MHRHLKKIAGNAGALFLVQVANYLLPLVLAPYLTRKLGITEYGVVALSLSIIQISGILTDFGFTISATYLVAKANSAEEIKKITGAVYTCKALLLIPALIFIFIFPITSAKYIEHKELFWITSISVVGIALQPTWLFQGLEKMKIITSYTVLARLSLILLTISLVNSEGDGWVFTACNGISQSASAIACILFLRKKKLTPTWESWNYTLDILKKSSEFFWSRAAVGTYGAGAIFVLGFISTPAQIAYYSVAEQFYRGAISLYSPITQALYPHMAKHRDLENFKRILILSMATGALGIFIGIYFGNTLIISIFGSTYAPAHSVLVIFMLSLTAAIPSIIIGYPLLGAFGHSKVANYSVIYAGLVQILLIILCAKTGHNKATDIAMTVFLSELFTLMYRARFARKILGKTKHDKTS